jgi:hypothetical protein
LNRAPEGKDPFFIIHRKTSRYYIPARDDHEKKCREGRTAAKNPPKTMYKHTRKITLFSVTQKEYQIQNYAKKGRNSQQGPQNYCKFQENELGSIHKPLESTQEIEKYGKKTHDKKKCCDSIDNNNRKLFIQ